MDNNNQETDILNLGTAPAMSQANSMQAEAHSTGLMFSNAANQQQLNFQQGLSTSTMNIKKILNVKNKQTIVFGNRRSRLLNIEDNFES